MPPHPRCSVSLYTMSYQGIVTEGVLPCYRDETLQQALQKATAPFGKSVLRRHCKNATLIVGPPEFGR
jgi:hypothetical protein